MSEDRPRPEKGLKEKVKELVEDVIDALEELVAPPQELVPVRSYGRRRPKR